MYLPHLAFPFAASYGEMPLAQDIQVITKEISNKGNNNFFI